MEHFFEISHVFPIDKRTMFEKKYQKQLLPSPSLFLTSFSIKFDNRRRKSGNERRPLSPLSTFLNAFLIKFSSNSKHRTIKLTVCGMRDEGKEEEIREEKGRRERKKERKERKQRKRKKENLSLCEMFVIVCVKFLKTPNNEWKERSAKFSLCCVYCVNSVYYGLCVSCIVCIVCIVCNVGIVCIV